MTVARHLTLVSLLVANAAVSSETHVVLAKDYRFDPGEIQITVGDTVRWENREKVQYHSVHFPQIEGDPVQDYFWPGESRERTFNQAGTYDYICEPHWETHKMRGVVKVIE